MAGRRKAFSSNQVGIRELSCGFINSQVSVIPSHLGNDKSSKIFITHLLFLQV